MPSRQRRSENCIFSLVFSENCLTSSSCDTCPGGEEFTNDDRCPNSMICEEFMCETNADCNFPQGTCNPATETEPTRRCTCIKDFMGLDCSLGACPGNQNLTNSGCSCPNQGEVANATTGNCACPEGQVLSNNICSSPSIFKQ